jgi:Na+/H+ antiporter NhaB
MAAPAPGPSEPTPAAPERVRVVLADIARERDERRGAQVRAELQEQSGVGEALVSGLMRTQLGLALRLAVVVTVGLGGLPLLFAVAPAVAEVRPFGVALPWLLLGVAAYPFLFGVGATYVWLSERTEREFAELVDRKGTHRP